jgi:hypothetical protein
MTFVHAAAKGMLRVRRASQKQTFKLAQLTQTMLHPASRSAKRRLRPLKTRQILQLCGRSMPRSHEEEQTFAAYAAADHLRTVRMPDRAEVADESGDVCLL